MGYYTNYELLVDVSKSEPNTIQRLENSVEELEGFSYTDATNKYLTASGYAKWYSCDDDMRKLSRLFPDFLFELHGEGDSPDDLWNTYYQDGKMQHCPGKIFYEPYDPEKMEGPEKRDKYLEGLWDQFADIPMNPDTECIETQFFEFQAGTPREDIWHWFDKQHSKGVHYLLYERGQ